MNSNSMPTMKLKLVFSNYGIKRRTQRNCSNASTRKKYINKDKRKGQSEGWAALNLASFNDHKEIVELLLQDNSIEIIHQTNDG